MKFIIRIISIALALLFCLTACSGQPAAQTTASNDELPEPITLTADTFSAMHLSVNDADILTDDATIRVQGTDEFVDTESASQMTLSYDNNSHSVFYKQSYIGAYGNQFDQYQSETESLAVHYLNKTNKITQITATRDYFALPDNLKSEEDYLNWIKELLKGYGVTDLSAYEYSCKTGLTEFGDDWAGGASRDYFYEDIDPTCEELTSYTFTYTRIIDGYVTSDYIRIYISISTDMMILNFDQEQFANVAKIELDETKMLETLDEYVKGCVNIEKYELLSYTVENQTLTYVDQKLCMVCSVEMILHPLAIPDIESFPVLETIGVFCE